MLFPTADFAIFFAIVFTLHWLLLPLDRVRKAFLLAASYVFYAWWDWRFVFLLAAATVLNGGGALAVARLGGRARDVALAATIAADLGLLGFFKYAGFLALNVDNALVRLGAPALVPLVQIALPVGISFFTFMGISYVVDVHRQLVKPAGWLDFAVYLSFFPHLVAGPIVRGADLLPQLRIRPDPQRIELARAVYLLFGGLFKKVVISSYLATTIVDPVFGVPSRASAGEILFAVYGYAVQIYADFSGYTDMAIGVALLLGYRFPTNFASPYAARSLREFWQRWHITLSTWLRDYVYIPLGGSRRGPLATYRNLVVTMALGGLWHGAAWTFVAWGLLHGAGQVVGHAYRDAGTTPRSRWRDTLGRLATFHFVCLGWIFFRAGSIETAFELLRRLFGAIGPMPMVTPLVVAAIAVGIGTQYLPRAFAAAVQSRFAALHPLAQGAALAIGLAIITALGPEGVAPFIYYRF